MHQEDPFMLVRCLSLEGAGSDSDECLLEGVLEKQDRIFEWENSRFKIKFASGPTQCSPVSRISDEGDPAWNDYVPRIECTTKSSPIRPTGYCKSKFREEEITILHISEVGNLEMLYTPEEAPDAVRIITDEALYAVEACRFMEEKVKELYSGAELYDSSVELKISPEGVAGSFDEFCLIEEAADEGWSRMVWRNSRFIVGLYEVGEGLLHVECEKANSDELCPSPRIIARPQLVGAYLEPLLYIDLSPRLWRIETADRDAQLLIAETEVAVKICKFLREQVSRYYPEYVL